MIGLLCDKVKQKPCFFLKKEKISKKRTIKCNLAKKVNKSVKN